MHNTLKKLAFIFLIPFLAALGYDLYNNFYVSPENIAKLESLTLDPSMVKPMDFGYLLLQYVPDALNSLRSATSPEIWIRFINPVLEQYTTVLAAIPLIFIMILMVLESIIDYVRLRLGKTGHLKSFESKGLEKNKTFEYKRK